MTLVSYGASVRLCRQAADVLDEREISAEVIDLRTLYPLDMDTICASVRKTGRAIIVDESAGYGGVSAELAASIQRSSFNYLDAPIGRIHAAHSPVPQSPPLIKAMMPSSQTIVDEASLLMQST
jgi:pyruvate/2-oxoglutarate/acetoin dehydrogenase E1 component